MINLSLSNSDLDHHRKELKRVTNPNARWVSKPGHKQRNFTAKSDDGKIYKIYQRQNLDDKNDFSCGLSFVLIGGKSLSLVCYNGPQP